MTLRTVVRSTPATLPHVAPVGAHPGRGLVCTSIALALACSWPVRGQVVVRPVFYAHAGIDSAPPALMREFRGVWVATVDNIDWPSRPGLPVDSQKTELIALLDRAASLHLNAIVFQVRPSADALYASKLEPWSSFLTGTQGRAPRPFYDPLAFVVAESHNRGMELHAWFNPYRAKHPADKSRASRTHVSRARPGVVKKYGPYLWMDPGDAWVRKRTIAVVLDVVRRYDIDGVHMDDYFYPYPEKTRRGREIDFPDAPSWRRYVRGGGERSRADWRRRNVDLLVEELARGIKQVKPWVRFGVSPFGIWRPGYPESVRGFDAYDRLYADSRRWLAEGWVDYFTPQLYWKTTAPEQGFAALLGWWRGENVKQRHLWPGVYTGRVAAGGSNPWLATEIVEQIRITREEAEAPGNVHFSMKAFVTDADSLDAHLRDGPYAAPALVPSTAWLSTGATAASPVVTRTDDARGARLTVARIVGQPTPQWWLVRARYGSEWRATTVSAAVTAFTVAADEEGSAPGEVFVSAIDRVGVESGASVASRSSAEKPMGQPASPRRR